MHTFDLPGKFTLDDTFRLQLETVNQIIDYLQNPFSTQAGAIMFFDKSIDRDVTIPGNKRALSIDVTIEDGNTVTVEAGASFVVL